MQYAAYCVYLADTLKGQSYEIDLQFFSPFKQSLATDQWVKIFSILIRNSQSYLNFKSENLNPQGIIPRRVRLPVVSYPSKSISRGIIPRQVNLPRLSYPCESISPGYHTPTESIKICQNMTPRGMIPRRVNLPGVSYPSESLF